MFLHLFRRSGANLRFHEVFKDFPKTNLTKKSANLGPVTDFEAIRHSSGNNFDLLLFSCWPISWIIFEPFGKSSSLLSWRFEGKKRKIQAVTLTHGSSSFRLFMALKCSFTGKFEILSRVPHIDKGWKIVLQLLHSLLSQMQHGQKHPNFYLSW